VQAPAGSGKTELLTRRFLQLLGEVDEPGQVVAITFTNAAAAEMRNRVLDELGKTEPSSFAARVLLRSQSLGWQLLDLPALLRIRTIDSFCRELALQQPLLSSFGGSLEIAEQPEELYRRAARETLRKIDQSGTELSAAIEELLLWRDNGWQEMEELLVEMLSSRDRWMHNIVLEREPNWAALRERLERPLARAVQEALDKLSRLLDQLPGARETALEVARFACEEPGANSPWQLAECADIPAEPFTDDIEAAREFYLSLSEFLQTQKGSWRLERGLKTSDGFPSTPRGKAGKARFASLIAALNAIPGLEAALAAVRTLPPARYSEDDWRIIRACFTLLRHAAGELQIVFAETGRVDYTEIAQIAQRVLRGEDGQPTDAALAVADKIRHLLVDEFQDTSRRQHQLLSSLIAAWPEREGRTCFVVGDPMQSIYFFRDADAELFPRVRDFGLELPHEEPLLFDPVSLTANFRTAPGLVEPLNQAFAQIFAADDGSGVAFSPAIPARKEKTGAATPFTLHLKFVPQTTLGNSADLIDEKETARAEQLQEIVSLIRGQMSRILQARASGEPYRIAVLGRAKNQLVPIAQALRDAGIPFRAIELERLADRPEVLDALALARALLNPQDRVAWLGLLRAPWCGLSLEDLHTLAGDGAPELLARPVPELLAERLSQLSEAGRLAAARVLDAMTESSVLRAAQPAASLGSWLEAVWLLLGGAACADAAARANLDLLWSCLDHLPNGEEDLLGPGLDAALGKLTALPDPKAGSDCGVQLMTIHKSKGLEFEVVLVPDLQARTRGGSRKMLSWLERGLAEPDDSGAITEFLIAPFQRKGTGKGSAKNWVDSVYHEREEQENRRILYVASTRAREQLHLFARPAYKSEADGGLILVNPTNSLLATAWPALEEEVRTRFEEWKTANAPSQAHEDQVLDSIAAAGSNLLLMAAPIRPAPLRRLPPEYRPEPFKAAKPGATGLDIESWERSYYSRHEGGLLSRALGTAVHALLEELARLRTTLDWEASRAALLLVEPSIAAQARGIGIGRSQAAQIAREALQLAIQTTHDPLGAWLLSPHEDAASEAAWAGIVGGSLRSVRVDRVFRAGPKPASEGEDCWWIIDYKTAYADNLAPEAVLPQLREIFAPQVEAYAELLRKLHGSETPIFAGLYYPRMLLLDWWQP
jgi:ATP-dependent exoDNAse (exonuclease V) beta subunit